MCGIPDIAVGHIQMGLQDHDDHKHLLIFEVTDREHLESVCFLYASTGSVAREGMAVACARGERVEEMVI